MVNIKNNKIILNFSSTDNGGAGEAAIKFHQNLKKANFKSFLFVARKTKNDKTIFLLKNNLAFKIQGKIVQLKNFLNITNKDYFFLNSGLNFNINLKKICKIVKKKNINSIVIHSVPNFLDFRNILYLKNYFKCKVYFRLYDMQNFTGGCSYSLGCDKFKYDCFNCPGITNNFFNNLPFKNLLKKKFLLKKINPEILSSSYYEMIRSKESSLFKNCKHHILYCGVNSNIFKKIFISKKKQNNKTIFLFGSSDLEVHRKGLFYFLKALEKVKYKQKIKIITIGAKKNYFAKLQIQTKNYKFINDQKLLNKVLNEAHFCVIPSIDETGPTMLNMAMMASVPCITFNIGDAYKHVKNNKTGFKCKNKDIVNLRKNIHLAIKIDKKKFNLMKINSRKVALKFFADKTQVSLMKKIII